MCNRATTLLITLTLVASIGGCDQHSYRHDPPTLMSDGATVTPLGADIFRVYYNHGTIGTGETAQTYWLYRCAELALEKGYDGFVVIGDTPFLDPTSKITMEDIRDKLHVPDFRSEDWDSGFTRDIELRKMPFEAHPPKSFDARKLKEALDPILRAPPCGADVCPHVKPYLYPDALNQ